MAVLWAADVMSGALVEGVEAGVEEEEEEEEEGEEEEEEEE